MLDVLVTLAIMTALIMGVAVLAEKVR